MTTPKFEGESPLYRVSPQGSMTEVPSLRDQFAMAIAGVVLQPIIHNAGNRGGTINASEVNGWASIVWVLADAMLEAREAKP
jgi:hypothetical protein